MSDSIANFPLRSAMIEQLSDSMARAFGDFNSWLSQADGIVRFLGHAESAGIRSLLSEEAVEAFNAMLESRWLLPTENAVGLTQEMIDSVVDQQMRIANHGAKLAAVTIVHNATERLLWRLIRFAAIYNRERAIEYVEGKKVSISEIVSKMPDELIDMRIEEWWGKLERDSILRKWDVLAALGGFPTMVNKPPRWRFDKAMLEHFDNVRVNAVHHDGRELAAFNFENFVMQLRRAIWVWGCEIVLSKGIHVEFIRFMGVSETPST